MLGIFVIFTISWLIIYFVENNNLLINWFLPISLRIKQFVFGFLFTTIICTCLQYMDTSIKSLEWSLNSEVSFSLVLSAFLFDFKSVLTEELIFRGVLLYFLIKKVSVTKSIYLSAAAFGIYHWFSFGIIGNIVPMVLIFFGTGFMGYAWAKAYAKTQSILLPFGMHLGWNFVVNTIFSKGPLGELVFISKGGVELTGFISLVNFILPFVIAPILTLVYLKFFVSEYSE